MTVRHSSAFVLDPGEQLVMTAKRSGGDLGCAAVVFAGGAVVPLLIGGALVLLHEELPLAIVAWLLAVVSGGLAWNTAMAARRSRGATEYVLTTRRLVLPEGESIALDTIVALDHHPAEATLDVLLPDDRRITLGFARDATHGLFAAAVRQRVLAVGVTLPPDPADAATVHRHIHT